MYPASSSMLFNESSLDDSSFEQEREPWEGAVVEAESVGGSGNSASEDLSLSRSETSKEQLRRTGLFSGTCSRLGLLGVFDSGTNGSRRLSVLEPTC